MSRKENLQSILKALGVDESKKRPCSFAFTSKLAPPDWKAFTFDIPITFYYILAPGANITKIRSLALGIKAENYILVAGWENQALLVLRRSKKEDNIPLLVPLKKDDDFERIASVIRRFDFVSDMLTAHSSINSVVDSLKAGAEKYFINRGLFSNYFLKERMLTLFGERKRNLSKEAQTMFDRFNGELPIDPKNVFQMLEALEYSKEILSTSGYPEYIMRLHRAPLDVACVVADADSLDIKTGDKAAPSYQAVAALQRRSWVILTNGRLWRLYSNRVSSTSTNYFEVDLEGVASETDPRLIYFASMFSASSFLPREGAADIDLVYEGGIKHAQKIEENLRHKVFDEGLFLNLVKSTLNYSPSKTYSQDELDDAKARALKLLYRLLFILYAESRGLLPIENARYKEASLESLQQRLSAFEKEPDGTTVWDLLKALFKMVSQGNVEANMPQYDGALFQEDPLLDNTPKENRLLVPPLRDLMQSEGKGIDYQNLGVRHLGSLYEALLEFNVRQARQALVVYRDEILDAQYAEDLKQKPIGYVGKGGLYLSAKGLARKGTGSYYTPDEIVTFLVKKGLEPHFKIREEQFKKDLELFRASKNPEFGSGTKCTDDLLGLRVVDPAMGSGHFLVAAVNGITVWTINLLREYPDAPLMTEIEALRRNIIEEQRKKGIRIDEDLLTDSVILKRMVMKRCVYGVDINPLAVELAKVSLWLDSFTIGTPLTFLDHHIRCGDSLIGLWIRNIESKPSETTLTSWMRTVSNAGSSLHNTVSVIADLSLKQVSESIEISNHIRKTMEPLRVQLDIECARVIDSKLKGKLPRNFEVIEQACREGAEKPKWWFELEKGPAEKYRFFHWELEFPDAFTDKHRGFDLVVMNPPWDAVKPDDDDFFSVYYPRFRKIRSKPEKREVMKDALSVKSVSEAYEEYHRNIEERLLFFKESNEYVRRGSGDTNLWKLFLERALKVASKDGTLALVIPSGIVTDDGAKELREALLSGKIRAMYEFENKKGIFPDVDSRYKFVLMVTDKGEPTDHFPAAFYLHEVEALYGKSEKDKFVEIPTKIIGISAPNSLSIPEVRNNKQLEVFTWLYEKHPLLFDETKGWSVTLLSELHRTGDSDLFRSDGKGWPLIEGKHFHQFMPDFEKPVFTVVAKEGLERTSKHKEYHMINSEVHQTVRLAFRNVGSSTNVRSMVACILPPRCFSPHSVIIAIPKRGKMPVLDLQYHRMIAYLAAVFNSMVFDFLIRTRITMNLTYSYIYQTPVPADLEGAVAEQIIKISARLSSVNERFGELASTLEAEIGPLNVKELINLRAKLDALVATHYHLKKEQLEVILQSFEGFEEGKELEKIKEIEWNDVLIRKLNGEVRKRVLAYFDSLNPLQSG